MPRSRTITVLSLLVGAMTVGTFALLALETQPARPGGAVALSARNAATSVGLDGLFERTEIPLRQADDDDAWRRIVIHDGHCSELDAKASQCHFVIVSGGPDDGMVCSTERWLNQEDGTHIRALGRSYSATSIGICLARGTSNAGPSAKQIDCLVALVRSLQERFGIRNERVYLHGELTDLPCPAGGFPVQAFRRRVSAGR